mmetsp:Transcript_90431/g.210397  ORF Transcript_90431/g.210397 Transcript_90431/m.210397 type:complete len:324 (-) Transcript_90431:97-1068(-)
MMTMELTVRGTSNCEYRCLRISRTWAGISQAWGPGRIPGGSGSQPPLREGAGAVVDGATDSGWAGGVATLELTTATPPGSPRSPCWSVRSEGAGGCAGSGATCGLLASCSSASSAVRAFLPSSAPPSWIGLAVSAHRAPLSAPLSLPWSPASSRNPGCFSLPSREMSGRTSDTSPLHSATPNAARAASKSNANRHLCHLLSSSQRLCSRILFFCSPSRSLLFCTMSCKSPSSPPHNRAWPLLTSWSHSSWFSFTCSSYISTCSLSLTRRASSSSMETTASSGLLGSTALKPFSTPRTRASTMRRSFSIRSLRFCSAPSQSAFN